ncbi:MAG: ATP-dependent DNA helicase [bacterium]|nr:ATP-dependent DNA helicase [bacterium]
MAIKKPGAEKNPARKQSNLLDSLNEEQKDAVTQRTGPVLIIAGAGTGKTTVITRRIAWLIEQGLAKPDEILALTFTDKSSAEMEERVDKLLPHGYLDLWISTFHAFGQRILESHALDIGLPINFRLLSQTEQWVLVRENLDKFGLDYYRPLGNPTRFIHALLSHFSRAKDEMITPEGYLAYAKELQLNLDGKMAKDDLDAAEAARVAEVAEAFAVYQKLLADNGALDFGDLIAYTYQLFAKRPKILEKYRRQFKYVLVDEFQDTNYAQYELVKLLSAPANNITVVGDDDQSIYKFRGASVSNILKFKDDYQQTREITLTKNYRSRQNLLDLSYAFIQKNSPDRLEDKLKISKKLIAKREGEGVVDFKVYQDYHAEALAVVEKIAEIKSRESDATWNDFAILVRANDTAEPFLDVLERAGLPYIQLSRKGLYRKPVVADVISYLRLLDNYHESKAMFRVINFPLFKFTNDDLAKIVDFSSRKTYSLYEAIKHPELISTLSGEAAQSANKILSLIEEHTNLARSKSVAELFVAVVEDLKIAKSPSNQEAMEYNLGVLDQFNRKIQDFCSRSERKFLKDFMQLIEMELSSGELGSMDIDSDMGPEAIKIITVHSAKGLEFRYVFLPALADKKFPAIGRSEPIEIPDKLVREILPAGDANLQEERRLFYVAATRARDGLYFSYAQDYGGSTVRKPSIFLKDLGLVSGELSLARPTGQVAFAPPKRSARKLRPPKTFSFSSISAFIKCPLEYKYAYLLRLPTRGSAALSFGQTIHRTLENYLKIYLELLTRSQGDLFGDPTSSKKPDKLPAEEKLLELYEQSWVDDWYDDKSQKDKYRKRGRELLKTIYDKFVASPPTPAFLEKKFRLDLDGRVFTGKIDRADKTPSGLVIIDYKTGASRTLGKVDRDQLLIYQWAVQDYLKEKVSNLQYWYFDGGLVIKDFLGDDLQIEDLKKRLLETIRNIEDAVAHDSFEKYHKKHQHCEFENLA